MSIKTLLLGINPQKAFDTIASGVDKLAFTKQERADLNLKLADKVADFAEKTMSESTVRSKARRMITYVIVFCYIGLVIASLFSKDVYLHSLVKDSAIQMAFIMVMAFFFGSYLLSGTPLKK